jgi:hypothetical protein
MTSKDLEHYLKAANESSIANAHPNLQTAYASLVLAQVVDHGFKSVVASLSDVYRVMKERR